MICMMLAAGLAGCNEHKQQYVSIDEGLKSKVHWKPGSYWIMQDSATSRIDSIYVVSNVSRVNEGQDNRSNEVLDISLNEVSVAAPAQDSAWWYMAIGDNGNTVQADLFFDTYGHPNSTSTQTVFPILFNPAYARTAVSFYGTQYEHVCVTPGSMQAVDRHAVIGMQEQDGFVYMNIKSGNYDHVWHLLRRNMVR